MGKAWVDYCGIEEQLLAKVRSCDIIISDLDGTDTPSTGAREVLRYVASHTFDTTLQRWSWKAARAYLLDKNITSAHIWHGFVAHFLTVSEDGTVSEKRETRTISEEKERLHKIYTPKHASSLLYPGVRDFYHLLRAAEKIYVTKAVYEIAAGFAAASHFDLFFADAYDKAHIVQRVIEGHAHRQRYLVKGDTSNDETMLDVLHWYKKKGTIDDVVGINVCRDDECINPHFDINIGRDYRGLVDALKRPL